MTYKMLRGVLPPAWLLLCGAVSASAQLSVSEFSSFERVSTRRVTRVVTEFEYRAKVTNGAPALANVTAVVTSTSPDTTVIDGALRFPDLPFGGSGWSIDTFTIRHDRRTPFDPAVLDYLFDFDVVFANTPPVADAGPDQTVLVTERVALNGSGSFDVDGDVLTYFWTLVSVPPASTAALSDPAAVTPGFVADVPGTYVAELIVSDGNDDSVPDTVAIDTENSPPAADAGPDQTVFVNETVVLDGSRSSDVDGDVLRFSWSLTDVPSGSAADLSDPAVVKPTFVVDVPGTYVAELIVNDGALDSHPDTVVIDTGNSPPIADAGQDQTVFVTDAVTLDGSGSSDVDGDLLSFFWSLASVPSGSTAVLSDPAALMPSFDVDLPGTYVAQLIVNDGFVDSPPDTVTVDTENTPPIADAGPDRTAFVTDRVTLDGTGSSDVDGDALRMEWSFTAMPAGSTAALSSNAASRPTFEIDLPGIYVVQLIVHDGTVASTPDSVSITTLNSPPVADAGDDQAVFATDAVRLDGSRSSDVDGDPLTFSWSLSSLPAGSAASLDDASSVTPSFTADVPGSYVAQLIVNDGTVDSDPNSVVIVTNNSPPVAHAGPDQTVPSGSTVTLDATLSSDVDSDPLTYQWSLSSIPGGSTATLSDPTTVAPTFVGDVPGEYTAELVVHDGALESLPDTVRVTVEPAPALTPFSRTIGAGLQFSDGARLEVSNHGGVVVHLESSDPSVVLIAPDAATPGAPSLDVAVPDGSRFAPYVAQAVAGALGSVTVTATAAGFAVGQGTVTVVEGAVALVGPGSPVAVGNDRVFTVRTGIAHASGTFLSSLQGLSAANVPAPVVTVRSSDPAVAGLRLGGSTAGEAIFGAAPGEFQWNLTFVPLVAGSTTVSVSIPGFDSPAAASQVVEVTPPGISAFSRTIGSGLQYGDGARLGITNHGGVTVRVESSNPAVATIAPDEHTPGSSFIDVVVPAGESFAPYTVQGVLGSAGDVTVTASAPGFDSGTGDVTIVPGAVSFGALDSHLAAGTSDLLDLFAGIPNGSGTGLSSIQGISAGIVPPLDMTVSSSDGSVGRITYDGTTADSIVISLASGEIQWHPRLDAVAPGVATVTVSVPGFLTVPSAGQTVTVVP